MGNTATSSKTAKIARKIIPNPRKIEPRKSIHNAIHVINGSMHKDMLSATGQTNIIITIKIIDKHKNNGISKIHTHKQQIKTHGVAIT
jgi:hypothetical protein